jgi:hypothetical protein
MNNEKKNGYWYADDNIVENIDIYQYMRLDYLLNLLETNKYYVKKRKTFIDANESEYNMRLAFDLIPSIVGSNSKPNPHPERLIPYTEILECPTSCWTKTKEESFMMWKVYANEIGVRIKSSTGKILNSINLDTSINSNNRLICGSMKYVEHPRSFYETGQLFNKSKEYFDENEFRFYFDFKKIIKKDKDFVEIPIHTKSMIDEITISPFICKIASDKIKRIISESYGINNVKQSKIKLK